nr:hypothetical protein CFP56_70769 [Quercus suber]
MRQSVGAATPRRGSGVEPRCVPGRYEYTYIYLMVEQRPSNARLRSNVLIPDSHSDCLPILSMLLLPALTVLVASGLSFGFVDAAAHHSKSTSTKHSPKSSKVSSKPQPTKTLSSLTTSTISTTTTSSHPYCTNFIYPFSFTPLPDPYVSSRGDKYDITCYYWINSTEPAVLGYVARTPAECMDKCSEYENCNVVNIGELADETYGCSLYTGGTDLIAGQHYAYARKLSS